MWWFKMLYWIKNQLIKNHVLVQITGIVHIDKMPVAMWCSDIILVLRFQSPTGGKKFFSQDRFVKRLYLWPCISLHPFDSIWNHTNIILCRLFIYLFVCVFNVYRLWVCRRASSMWPGQYNPSKMRGNQLLLWLWQGHMSSCDQ